MYYLNYSHTLRALDGYVATHNKEKVTYKERVRPAMVATAQQLLKIYGIALAKSYKRKAFTKEELPALRTNNIQLAKLTHASTRTVQRHLVRLQAAGIITKKRWHGSKAPFELWFSPKVLSLKLPDVVIATVIPREIDSQKDVDKYVEKPVNNLKNGGNNNFLSYTDNQCFKNKNTSKSPHTDTRNITSNINNIIKRVNKLLTPIEKKEDLNKKITGNTGQEWTPLALRFSLQTGNTTGNTGEKWTPLTLRGKTATGNIFFYWKHTRKSPDKKQSTGKSCLAGGKARKTGQKNRKANCSRVTPDRICRKTMGIGKKEALCKDTFDDDTRRNSKRAVV